MPADRSVVVRLRADIAGYVSNIEAAAKATKDFSTDAMKASEQHKQAWDKTGVAMLAAGGIMALGVVEATRAAAEFDAQMSVVKANIDDKSAPSMARLAAAALHAGQTTAYSALDAARAEEELAKAGISSADIVGGALAASLSLASAGQLDLAAAAEITSSTMVQFGLHAKDAGHIADVLAAGADKSLGGVRELADGLKFVGVAASQSGMSLDQTVGVLADFASYGILGTLAGTGLREMLVKLAAPTRAAKDWIDKLGLSFYDNQGHFLGMANVAEQLHTKLAGLTDQQRQQALVQLFGQRAMAEGNILYREGAAGVEDWTNKVNAQGFAAMQATTKLDNLSGDLTKFKNTLNANLIAGGEAGQGPLRSLVQDATHVVDVFGSLPAPLQSSAVAMAGVSAVALITGGSLLTLVPKIAETRAAMAELNVGTDLGALSLGKFGAMAAAAAVAIPIVSSATNAFYTSLGYGNESTSQATKGLEALVRTGKATGDNADLMNDRWTNLGETVDQVFNGSAWHMAVSAMSKLGTGFGLYGPTVTDASVTFFKTLDQGLAGLVQGGHADQAAKLFKTVADEAKSQGYDVQKVTDALPAYSAALTASKGSADDLLKSQVKLNESARTLGVDADAATSAVLILGKGFDATSTEAKDLAKQITSAMDATSKAFTSQEDVLGKYKPGESLKKAYAAAVAESQAFTRDITEVTKRGLDPSIVSKLLQEGPAKAKPILEALIADHSGRLIKMANDNEAALAKINAQAVEEQRLTTMAINSTTDQMTSDISAAMQIAQAKSLQGATATATSIATALRMKKAEVLRIASEYGIGISDPVRAAAAAATTAIHNIPAGKYVTITANTGPAIFSLNALEQRLQALASAHYTTSMTTLTSTKAAPTDPTLGGILHKADGGFIHGPGSGTSDSIPAWLSNGEFVINADSTKRYRPLLEALNAKKFATGGLVGGSTGSVDFSGIDGVLNAAPTTWAEVTSARGKVTTAHKAVASIANTLANMQATVVRNQRSLVTAEAALSQVERHKHTPAQLVAAEARVANARTSLATSTRHVRVEEGKLTASRIALTQATQAASAVSARYALGQKPLADRYHAAASARNGQTAAFLANVQTLARKGFGVLAMDLLDENNDEAYALAAQAVSMPGRAATLQADFAKSAALSAQYDALKAKLSGAAVASGAPGYANVLHLAPSSQSVVVQAAPGPHEFTGQLVLDSGQFLGMVSGTLARQTSTQARALMNGGR